MSASPFFMNVHARCYRVEIIFYKKTWILNSIMTGSPIPVAARSNAWVCGRLRAGIVVRIPPGRNVCPL